MVRPTIPNSRPTASLLRRIGTTTPVVVGVYALSSMALGFGFANPVVDAVGLLSTTGGYLAGNAGIHHLTSSLDSV